MIIDYAVHPRIKICYDSKRYNSHYFARVRITVSEGKREKNLEVILNGSGRNKAIKKVQSKLRSMGINTRIGWGNFI